MSAKLHSLIMIEQTCSSRTLHFIERSPTSIISHPSRMVSSFCLAPCTLRNGNDRTRAANTPRACGESPTHSSPPPFCRTGIELSNPSAGFCVDTLCDASPAVLRADRMPFASWNSWLHTNVLAALVALLIRATDFNTEQDVVYTYTYLHVLFTKLLHPHAHWHLQALLGSIELIGNIEHNVV